MARCYSTTQRNIIAFLAEEFDPTEPTRWHHLRDITSALGPATNVEFDSVRRAIPRLAEEQLIELQVVQMPQWGTGRTQSYVRLMAAVPIAS